MHVPAYDCAPAVTTCDYCEKRDATIMVRTRKGRQAACDSCAFLVLA